MSRLGGLNTFCNNAIEPALENSIVDVELGLALERLLLPELGAYWALAVPRMPQHRCPSGYG
jgi:hypothetical protein